MWCSVISRRWSVSPSASSVTRTSGATARSLAAALATQHADMEQSLATLDEVERALRAPAHQRELDRVEAVWSDLPALRRAVTFEPYPLVSERVTELADLLEAKAAPTASDELDARLEAATADEASSIIYTSGTTGEPRGAVLTHRGFTYQCDALDKFFTVTPADHSLSFLPLSHALERAWTYYVLTHGCMNTYTDARRVAEMLILAEPTLLVSVPRLYEKVLTTARAKVAGNPAKQKLFDWALRVGGQCQRARDGGLAVHSTVLLMRLPLLSTPVMRNGPGGALAKSKENTGFSLTGSKVWMRSSSRSPASRTDKRLT